MMSRALAVIVLVACAAAPSPVAAPPPPSREPPPGSQRLGVFEGKVPCADCNRVKVRLTLHRDAGDAAPTAYLLERIRVGNGDERLVDRGRWTITTGTKADPRAPVANLDGAPPDFAHYQMVGDDLLLLLDAALAPRVGNAEHSFTLSRTE